MAPKATKLAVLGVPDLVPLLVSARFRMLTSSTDPAEVAKAAREAGEGTLNFVVRASDDSRVEPWVNMVLQQGREVVVVRKPSDPQMRADGAKVVELPATMDAITAQLGAPARPGGSTIIDFPEPVGVAMMTCAPVSRVRMASSWAG